MSSPLRILMVSDVSPLHVAGGAERVLWEYASRLVKRGHRVRVVCRAPAGHGAERSAPHGVEVSHFGVDRRSAARLFLSSIRQSRRAVAAALKEEPVDVMHCHQPLSAFGALTSRPELPAALYTFHSSAPQEYMSRAGMTALHFCGLRGRATQSVLWAIERSALRRAVRIQVLSSFSAHILWQLYGIPEERITRIPGGADLDRFHPTPHRSQVRRDLRLPADGPTLLTVRNLEARMGLDTLIRATDVVRRTIPELLLLIGGSGSLRTSLESLVASLNLARHVRFLGYVPEEDLARYYQAADAFVLPTRSLEGFGLITVEALACGTPVLGTQVGATPEILRPLDSPLLFSDTTPEAMAEDLTRFLKRRADDAAWYRELQLACRRHAERLYDWNLSVGRLEETFHWLVGQGGQPSTARVSCPACGGTDLSQDVAYVGLRYCRCPRCRTLVQANRPSREDLRSHYEVTYPLRFDPASVSASRRALFHSMLERLGRLRASGRLLDVGCGGGHLLTETQRRGWRVVGTDLSLTACRAAGKIGHCVVQGAADATPLRSASFDGVLLVNVLDHTREPFDTLAEARRVLRPGGVLVLRIPNAAFHRPWIRILTSLGPVLRWRGWDAIPILHVCGFTPRGLRALIERAGFRVLEMRNSSLAAEAALGSAPARRVGLSMAKGVLSGLLTLTERLSLGRWLIGPSIELYALRAEEPGP